MATYTTIDDPEAYFQVKTYTGDGTAIGSGGLALTLDGDTDMQPDLVWIKCRSNNDSHANYDAVRGVNKRIGADETSAEASQTEGLATFGSDGFTVGSLNASNGSARTYVAWNWKETATAGFDIVGYTGNATARTIAHSLSAVPHVIIVKPRESSSEGWSMYHKGIASDAETDNIRLDEANAAFDNAGYWNDTAPTSSVFTVGSDSATNHDGGGIIAYLFSEKQGFSKFSSFLGNGNADGTFVYTGFRPAFVLGRNTGASHNWWIADNKRDTYNVMTKLLRPDTNAADSSGTVIDFLSNGFKLRESGSDRNESGETIIYMAFAEAPFVNSNGVPCNAR